MQGISFCLLDTKVKERDRKRQQQDERMGSHAGELSFLGVCNA
eukprot:CAMPEP_0116844818 /NCGR_PEP_ID=MMETSP0418-20121206/12911_1 /TAXON_ID=1158023 /ORGANISM="Astrosyne radiata, Strain 13vi08-1A" /LENGTH=42 /DNA_ID= /DNA_START= /DNA_END= /DNA_ORIENTATION=